MLKWRYFPQKNEAGKTDTTDVKADGKSDTQEDKQTVNKQEGSADTDMSNEEASAKKDSKERDDSLDDVPDDTPHDTHGKDMATETKQGLGTEVGCGNGEVILKDVTYVYENVELKAVREHQTAQYTISFEESQKDIKDCLEGKIGHDPQSTTQLPSALSVKFARHSYNAANISNSPKLIVSSFKPYKYDNEVSTPIIHWRLRRKNLGHRFDKLKAGTVNIKQKDREIKARFDEITKLQIDMTSPVPPPRPNHHLRKKSQTATWQDIADINSTITVLSRGEYDDGDAFEAKDKPSDNQAAKSNVDGPRELNKDPLLHDDISENHCGKSATSPDPEIVIPVFEHSGMDETMPYTDECDSPNVLLIKKQLFKESSDSKGHMTFAELNELNSRFRRSFKGIINTFTPSPKVKRFLSRLTFNERKCTSF